MLNVEIVKFGYEETVAVTSLDVAETFGKEHYHVLEDIRSIQREISSPEFTGLFHESEYVATNGKTNPMYAMNRDGFTLLVMGYTGEKAMQFKIAYIKQFNAMEKALNCKRIEREKGIAVRQALTKAIQVNGENERMHGYAYSTYTNCIYKILFGMDSKQLREKYNVSNKDTLRNCFTAEELRAVESMEMIAAGLVDTGCDYQTIKDLLTTHNTKRLLCE